MIRTSILAPDLPGEYIVHMGNFAARLRCFGLNHRILANTNSTTYKVRKCKTTNVMGICLNPVLLIMILFVNTMRIVAMRLIRIQKIVSGEAVLAGIASFIYPLWSEFGLNSEYF